MNISKNMWWLVWIFLNLVLTVGKVYAMDPPGGPPPPGAIVQNPLTIENLQDFVNKILEAVVQIGLPVVTVALVYAGFLFVTARGSEDQLKKAKTAFLWTVIGAAVVLGAFVIETAIKSTVGGLKVK